MATSFDYIGYTCSSVDKLKDRAKSAIVDSILNMSDAIEVDGDGSAIVDYKPFLKEIMGFIDELVDDIKNAGTIPLRDAFDKAMQDNEASENVLKQEMDDLRQYLQKVENERDSFLEDLRHYESLLEVSNAQ